MERLSEMGIQRPDRFLTSFSTGEALLCRTLLRLTQSVTRLRAASFREPDKWLDVADKARQLVDACADKVSSYSGENIKLLLSYLTATPLYSHSKLHCITVRCIFLTSCTPSLRILLFSRC